MEIDNSVDKPPARGLLNFFQKTASKPKTILVESSEPKVQDDVVNVNDSVIELDHADEKENRKNDRVVVGKLMLKSRSNKKKRKKEESSDEEDFEDFLSNSKKKKSKSEESPVASPELNLDKVSDVPKVDDVVIDITDTSLESDPHKVATPSSSGKPSKPISSFFSKVTKEERLQKVEKENTQVQVKALVHDSPEEKSPPRSGKCSPLEETPRGKSLRKTRRSNVSRSAAETEKIEVIDVAEVKEVLEEEPSSSKERAEKAEVNQEVVELELDAAANADDVVSKISDSLFKSKRRSQETKAQADEDSDHSVNMESLENTPVKGDVRRCHGPEKEDQPSVSPVKNSSPSTAAKSAFSVLMSKKKSSQPEESPSVESEPSPIVAPGKPEYDEIDSRARTVFDNAFATLMKNSRKSFEPAPAEEEERLSPVTISSVALVVNQDSKTKQSPNAFLRMMRSSKAKAPEDQKLKNMLNVLNSVESEDEEADAEVMNIFSRKKEKRRKRRKEEKSPVPVDFDSDEEDDDESVFDVRCKNSTGKFFITKFESGGLGKCILFKDQWFTPNEFERSAGSRAKKYKVSLFVNNKPIHKLLEERNVRTPSRNSGRSTPASDGGRRSALLQSPGPSPSVKKQPRLEDVVKQPRLEEVKVEEVVESPGGRRSGRIARNAANMAEKRKQLEEQEEALEAAERKVEEERRLRNAAVKKQRKMMERMSQSQESSDDEEEECKVEKVVMKGGGGKTGGKLASIFTKKQKVLRPAEDPAVVEARKQFLMSSAPDKLRTQISTEKPAEGVLMETGGQVVCWPGPETCPSHVSDKRERSSVSGDLSVVSEVVSSDVTIGKIEPGMLGVEMTEAWVVEARLHVRLSEADVLATVEARPGQDQRMFNSLMERRLEAEMFEREAREKNLSVAEAEEKRLRGNRRRSRRSLEADLRGEAARYKVDSGSGLSWVTKYQPRCGADIMDNKDEVARLRDWLRNWISSSRASEGQSSEVSSEEAATDDSEYELDDDALEGLTNTALIEGPSGAGKTAAVFALAAEMGFNVLEVNASSNRTGKQVLSMLSEATQSQQVRRDGDKKTLNFGGKTSAKSEEDSKRAQKKMKTALILIEDIDLVFDDLDEGLYTALNTLSQQSKRPIIMTTSSITWFSPDTICPGDKLLRFSPKLFTLARPSVEMLSQTLGLVALMEGYHVSRPELSQLATSRDPRQCLLQLQLLCCSGLLSTNDTIDNDDANTEGNVDVRKWFRHLDAKTRRAGVPAPVSSLGSHHQLHYRGHGDYWSSLPGTKIPHPPVAFKYPLKMEDVPKAAFSRIDPLKNKDLFDDEDSNDAAEVKGVVDDEDKKVVPKLALTKEQRMKNYRSLTSLSSHLDTVSCWSTDMDAQGWHAIAPLADSCSAQLPLYRDETEHVNSVKQSLADTILPQSSHMVNMALDTDLELVEVKTMDKDEVWDSQQHVLCNSLVDIFLVDRVGRLELVSGLRTLARAEEMRRLQVSHDSRRGNRFSHYFAQSGAMIEEKHLISLCNALVN